MNLQVDTLTEYGNKEVYLNRKPVSRMKFKSERSSALQLRVAAIGLGMGTFYLAYLNSLDSVRNAAQQLLDDKVIPRVDVLIDNAGIMACPYAKTEDSLERQFATNHVGHFLLTNTIMPKLLVASPNARVVNVSSYGNVLTDLMDDPYFTGDGKVTGLQPLFRVWAIQSCKRSLRSRPERAAKG